VAGYRYAISLRFRHPSADLSGIGDKLGITPTRSWKAGDPRTTPKGTPLDGVFRDSYWTSMPIEGASSEATDLSEALGQILTQLSERRAFFADFADSGGRAELLVGWFFDEGNSGDVLPHELLARLAELRIDLSLDVYP
jgi:hypothetical protein